LQLARALPLHRALCKRTRSRGGAWPSNGPWPVLRIGRSTVVNDNYSSLGKNNRHYPRQECNSRKGGGDGSQERPHCDIV